MFVLLPVLADGMVRHGHPAVLGRVIVTGPDLDVARHAEKLACRVEEIVHAAAGKVASSRADVYVEQRVAAEDVVWGE